MVHAPPPKHAFDMLIKQCFSDLTVGTDHLGILFQIQTLIQGVEGGT